MNSTETKRYANREGIMAKNAGLKSEIIKNGG